MDKMANISTRCHIFIHHHFYRNSHIFSSSFKFQVRRLQQECCVSIFVNAVVERILINYIETVAMVTCRTMLEITLADVCEGVKLG